MYSHFTPRQITIIIAGLALGVLLASLNSTIAGTAMPVIAGELNGIELYSWPFTSYLLTSTVSIPISGNISGRFGHKNIFITGIIIFILSSVLCSSAQNMIQLIIFRALQGAGGGIIISAAYIIVNDMFPRGKAGRYIGYIVSMYGLSSIIGPMTGGLIVGHFSWRWVFLVNIPIGIISLTLIKIFFNPRSERNMLYSPDTAGTLTFLLTLVPVLLALSLAGRDYSWNSFFIISLMAVSIVSLPVFILVESRADDPLIPLFLFWERSFVSAITGAFFSYAVFYGGIVFIPLYLQNVMRVTPMVSGMCIMPMTLSFVISAIISGRRVSSSGRYRTQYITGFGIVFTGIIFLLMLRPYSSLYHVIAAALLTGCGLGINTPIQNIAGRAGFEQKHSGVATSTVQLFRNVGSVSGSAFFGFIMSSRIAGELNKIDFSGIPESSAQLFSNPYIFMNSKLVSMISQTLQGSSALSFEAIRNSIKTIFASSVHLVFSAIAATALLAFLLSFSMKEQKLQPSEAEENKNTEN